MNPFRYFDGGNALAIGRKTRTSMCLEEVSNHNLSVRAP